MKRFYNSLSSEVFLNLRGYPKPQRFPKSSDKYYLSFEVLSFQFSLVIPKPFCHSREGGNLPTLVVLSFLYPFILPSDAVISPASLLLGKSK